MGNISRRSFLARTAAVGAGVAFARPAGAVNRLIPQVVPSAETRPGTWTLLATTCRECPAGCGMHVRHIDGRAIKAEGNPEHPISRGALCARGQSSVQGLYDPDRVTRVVHRARGGEPRPADWSAGLEATGRRVREAGGRVAILSDLQTGALSEIMREFVRAAGSERLLFYEPLNAEALRAAHDRVFGLPVVPDYRLESCDFIVSFAADFLETWISPVQFAGAFADSHSYSDGRRGRLAYVGPRLSMTAANADDVLLVRPGAERWIALGMLRVILDRGWGRGDAAGLAALVGAADLKTVESLTGVAPARIEALARAFAEARGSVALAGPAGAHGKAAVETATAAALLNQAAGRVGQTLDFSRPHALGRAADRDEVERFLSELTGKDVLIVHGANPAYSLPGAAEHIRRAGTVVYLGTLMDETAQMADWFFPVDSPLESWGDYEPHEGVHCLMQPTMARLHPTRHAGDVLLAVAEQAGQRLARPPAAPAADFEGWLRERWRELALVAAPGRPFEEFRAEALRRGGCWGPRPGPAPAIRLPSTPVDLALPARLPETPTDGADLWAWASVTLFDGRHANRGWLQEAPDPVSTIVWRNWVDLHPRHASRLGLADGDIVAIENGRGRIEAPARITGDVADGVAAIALGQGHSALGRNAAGRGANAFALLGPAGDESPFGAVRLRRTGRRLELVSTCATQDQHDREILQWVELAAAARLRPGDGGPMTLPLPEGYDPRRDLYPPHPYPRHRWAMAADLDRCNGCGACAVACYAENNLAVAGEEQTGKGREMAWLRVVPYRDPGDPRRLGFLPVMCQHCDAAPCEPVCPVFASVHNDEGLNAQVYNRCIGTRYCSHNCPYKVRRFNWKDVPWEKPLDLQLNPDVTVRCRGVMEKCTFCIQRIREGEHRAAREDRPVRDGEIQPACVQTCPARALVFGDLLDPDSRIAAITRRDPRRYHVLEELNTKPAVAYLRRVKA